MDGAEKSVSVCVCVCVCVLGGGGLYLHSDLRITNDHMSFNSFWFSLFSSNCRCHATLRSNSTRSKLYVSSPTASLLSVDIQHCAGITSAIN